MSKSENLAIVYDDVTVTLGTLASKDAIAEASKIDSTRGNGFRIMKTEYWVDFRGKTANEGPLMVGMSAIFDAAGVESAIEADPQDSSEDSNNLLAKRPIWPLALLQAAPDGNDQQVQMHSVNPRWSVPEGENLYWWVYNMGAAGLTTGTVVHIFAKHYGVWLRD